MFLDRVMIYYYIYIITYDIYALLYTTYILLHLFIYYRNKLIFLMFYCISYVYGCGQ